MKDIIKLKEEVGEKALRMSKPFRDSMAELSGIMGDWSQLHLDENIAMTKGHIPRRRAKVETKEGEGSQNDKAKVKEIMTSFATKDSASNLDITKARGEDVTSAIVVEDICIS